MCTGGIFICHIWIFCWLLMVILLADSEKVKLVSNHLPQSCRLMANYANAVDGASTSSASDWGIIKLSSMMPLPPPCPTMHLPRVWCSSTSTRFLLAMGHSTFHSVSRRILLLCLGLPVMLVAIVLWWTFIGPRSATYTDIRGHQNHNRYLQGEMSHCFFATLCMM